MDEKVLSQEEVDALLETVDEPESGAGELGDGGIPPSDGSLSAADAREGENDSDGSRCFPLLRTQELTEGLESTMNMVHDSFAYSMTSTLSVTLRSQTRFNLVGIDALSYDQFIRGLPEPCSVWALRLEELNAFVILCFHSNLVHSVVDCLMGGVGVVPKERDSITELDQSVMESAVTAFCTELTKAWNRLLDFEMSIASHETRPGFLHIYSPAELMVKVTMSMALAETEANFYLGFPGPVINELSKKLDHQDHQEDAMEESVNEIKDLVMELPTLLEACLTPSTITTGDLLKMRPGDVIDIDHGLDRPIHVKVNGMEKFKARIMATKKRRIIEIV